MIVEMDPDSIERWRPSLGIVCARPSVSHPTTELGHGGTPIASAGAIAEGLRPRPARVSTRCSASRVTRTVPLARSRRRGEWTRPAGARDRGTPFLIAVSCWSSTPSSFRGMARFRWPARVELPVTPGRFTPRARGQSPSALHKSLRCGADHCRLLDRGRRRETHRRLEGDRHCADRAKRNFGSTTHETL